MSPSEFYELDMSDYAYVQAGWKNKMQIVEGWHRRTAYIIAQTNCEKDISMSFENWWPYGDKKIHDDIASLIKHKRERGKELMIKLSDNLQLHEAIKSLKKNGRRSINTNRR